MSWIHASRMRSGWIRRRVAQKQKWLWRCMLLRFRSKVIDTNRDVNTKYEWWETVYTDARQAAEAMGICDLEIGGFDMDRGQSIDLYGVWHYYPECVTKIKDYAPLDETLHDIVDKWTVLQTTYTLMFGNGPFSARFRLRDRYDTFDVYSNGEEVWGCDVPTNEAKLLVERFGGWILNQLEAECQYLESDEGVASTIAANDWHFDREGRIV